MLGMLGVLIMGTASAVSPTPSNLVDSGIQRYSNPEYAQMVNYKTLSPNMNFQAVVKGLPTDKFMIATCKQAILGILKAPSTAKFSSPKATLYHKEGQVYVNTGFVDSQNSYGAMLRSEYGCKSIFQGNRAGGTLFIYAYLFE